MVMLMLNPLACDCIRIYLVELVFKNMHMLISRIGVIDCYVAELKKKFTGLLVLHAVTYIIIMFDATQWVSPHSLSGD